MPFDGLFLGITAAEINIAADSHIDKIFQPSKEELVLVLRKKGFVKKLLLSAKGGMARVHFTENAPENPETPPMFCMLLRKHFSAARFSGVTLNGFERVAELGFSGTNELGDRVNLKIICEFIAGGNIILIGNDGRIIDAVHRSDIETSQRIIAPGAVYEYPPKQFKKNILNEDIKSLAKEIVSKSGRLSGAVLSTLDGASPLIAREIAYKSYGDDPMTIEIYDTLPLEKELLSLKDAVLSGGTPYIYFNADKSPQDFTFIKITQYGNSLKEEKCGSFRNFLINFILKKRK